MLLDEKLYLKFFAFIAKKIKADPQGTSDRDGLQYVDFDKNVDIYPCTKRGLTTYPIDGQSYILPSLDAKAMLAQLFDMGQLTLVTDTLQALAERSDGTPLQTSFPSLQEVNACVDSGLILPKALLEKLKEWEALGAAEVNFDFDEIRVAEREDITLKPCASCGAKKQVDLMKTCMHAQMHRYVCDTKCMNEFYAKL
jgi:hypothetical protein